MSKRGLKNCLWSYILGNFPSIIGQENRMASGGPEIAGTLSLIFCFFVNASACRDIEDVYYLEFFQTFLPRWEKQVLPYQFNEGKFSPRACRRHRNRWGSSSKLKGVLPPDATNGWNLKMVNLGKREKPSRKHHVF